MMAGVYFRPRADADIDEHYLYLGRQSSDLARQFIQQVELSTAILVESPEIGICYSSIHDRITDVLVFKIRRFPNHLIVYRPTEVGIEVVRVLHGARDIEALFEAGEIR